MIPTYRCVFIDWHGTLSTDRLWGHHPAFASLVAPLFAPTSDLAALLLPWLRGALASEAVVRALAEAGGVAYAPALREFIVGCRRMALVSAEIPRLIAALRGRGITVVIATDNTDAFVRWTVPSLGLERLFDAILCSSELGAVKPDADDRGRSLFFDAFLEAFVSLWDWRRFRPIDGTEAHSLNAFMGLRLKNASETASRSPPGHFFRGTEAHDAELDRTAGESVGLRLKAMQFRALKAYARLRLRVRAVCGPRVDRVWKTMSGSLRARQGITCPSPIVRGVRV